MTSHRFQQPDVLVLGGGGILGEAWMSSVLAGLAEATGFDPHGCEAYLGTSAGSIVDEWDIAWDGRLRISAVDMDSGRRVMFGEPGAPEASVADAVQASCAIPGFFRPTEVDGRSYVDGGVWSPTNMDRAPVVRGSRVLCLNPTAALMPSRDQPYGAMGLLSRSLAAVEAAYLERRSVHVQVVGPDAASVAAMGGRLMDGRRRGATLAAGLAQGRTL